MRAVAKSRGIPIVELAPVIGWGAGAFTFVDVEALRTAREGPARPRDAALILHTSGTTARPKAVSFTHADLCIWATSIASAFELTAEDCCLSIMPLFHAHGLVTAVLSSLLQGGSSICIPAFDGDEFFRWLQSYSPTWYTAVPAIHQVILERTEFHREAIARCPLRFVRSCSAALRPELMIRLEKALNAPVLDSYGITEVAHLITSNPLPPHRRKSGSVGVPTGPKVGIMDESGHLLGKGETGEIVVRGSDLTPGYVNNPEANESAFTDGWLRTGDRGYFDDDGYLFIRGRVNEVINRGGEKVTPLEVDEVLLEHPAVAEAVTFAVPHPTLGEDVAVAVTLRAGASATEGELRDLAFDRLADYKVPTQVVIVSEIPKGPTGKLLRIDLAESLAADLEGQFVQPRNAVEEVLVAIWREVLGVKKLGVYANFFALGGDSLSATQLLSRIKAAFGVELSVATTFRAPVLRDQALVVEEHLLRGVEQLDEEQARRLVE